MGIPRYWFVDRQQMSSVSLIVGYVGNDYVRSWCDPLTYDDCQFLETFVVSMRTIELS